MSTHNICCHGEIRKMFFVFVFCFFIITIEIEKHLVQSYPFQSGSGHFILGIK